MRDAQIVKTTAASQSMSIGPHQLAVLHNAPVTNEITSQGKNTSLTVLRDTRAK